jgi:hypothetical protein
MTRYINFLPFFLLLFSSSLFAQDNLYDCESSKNFAGYLFNTGQYDLSKHELERISFFCEPDETSNLMLLKSYRKLNEYSDAERLFQKIGKLSDQNLPIEFRDEYIRLMMSQKQYTQVHEKISGGFEISQPLEHLLGTELLLRNWEKAYQLSITDMPRTNFKIDGLKVVAQKSVLAKKKSPFLASIMSAIIPGAGKAYCGYWGDAVMSFMFTASSTFFAVRGFNKYGTKNVYPWIVGGFAVSYYTSNIYGGATSAIRYNENLDQSFIHETEKLLYSDY